MRPPGVTSPYVPRLLDRPTEVPLDADADLRALDEAKIFSAPDDPCAWPAWRAQLGRWRDEARVRVGYDGTRYDRAGPTPFVLGLAPLWDRTLYDHAAGRFTVDAYLEAAEADFGGFDAVLLWHGYPVVGIDERPQLDFFRDLPDLSAVCGAFASAGLQVYLPYAPWSDGDDADAAMNVAALVARVGADGVFLDTLREGSEALRRALDAVGAGLVMGGESRVPLARIHDHHLSWGQWFADSDVPGVVRAKWFERRHMVHHTRRWHRSHLAELHSAWLNGSGIVVWQNVFGARMAWSERDASLLRSMRAVHGAYAAHLTAEDWTPLADHHGGDQRIYASRWRNGDETLWTIVNRGDAFDGAWIVTDERPWATWTELTTGRTLVPLAAGPGRVALGGRLEAGGIAAVVASRPPRTVRVDTARVAAVRGRVRPRDVPRSTYLGAGRRPAPAVSIATVPPGLVAHDGHAGDLEVRYRVRECGLYFETPFVDVWKPAPGERLHTWATIVRRVAVPPFAIAEREVTNAAYARFLSVTGYAPLRADRFLAHWRGGRPAVHALDAPVVNVDLADARAYAAWAGLRLPTEDEWQLSGAAGMLRRGRPEVWNLTESEHDDGWTCFCILKGGAAMPATASPWQFDRGLQDHDVSAKLIELAGGLARSPSIGFRCAVGLADGT
ncbi:MAG: SUMF1/EgtB/PvdO family nonheme iron enzyme [Trueperaceae bacterium]|nr:SUMF1/EgtB/PvdO family nonheme iron enzyme [Trueperaceae bacterium]